MNKSCIHFCRAFYVRLSECSTHPEVHCSSGVPFSVFFHREPDGVCPPNIVVTWYGRKRISVNPEHSCALSIRCISSCTVLWINYFRLSIRAKIRWECFQVLLHSHTNRTPLNMNKQCEIKQWHCYKRFCSNKNNNGVRNLVKFNTTVRIQKIASLTRTREREQLRFQLRFFEGKFGNQ